MLDDFLVRVIENQGKPDVTTKAEAAAGDESPTKPKEDLSKAKP